MKRDPIKRILAFMLLFSLELFASSYSWQSYVEKQSVVENEPLYIKYICRFSDRAELYAVEFDPLVESEAYSIRLLREQTQIEDNRRVLTYEFVLYIHQAGEQRFAFETIMKKTSQKSIENTVIGRDNGEYAEYTQELIKQKEIIIDVKKSTAEVVGALELATKSDEKEREALLPYHLEITLKGVANFEAIEPIEFVIDGVRVFSEEPKIQSKLYKNGYIGEWSQKFAFVSDNNFTIPKWELKYYDLKSRSLKKLSIKAVDIEIKEGYKRELLLDKEEEKFHFSMEYLYYPLVFVFGFLVAKIEPNIWPRGRAPSDRFCQKVLECDSITLLSILLAVEDGIKYREIIEKIEKKELTSLKKAQKLICH